MILISAVSSILLLASPQQGVQSPASAGDLAPVVQRIATTVQLAAQEYRIGVSGGRVVMAAEVEEAGLFLAEARRTAERLPPESSRSTISALDEMIAAVNRTADPDSLAVAARTLTSGLAERYGVDVDQVPGSAPALARGAQVYQQNCAGCHGLAGRGDGPDGLGLTPPPGALSDGVRLVDVSPLDFYRRITIGVAGTAMPAFETRLSAADRWAAAAYATLLRYPAPAGEVPPGLRELRHHRPDVRRPGGRGARRAHGARVRGHRRRPEFPRPGVGRRGGGGVRRREPAARFGADARRRRAAGRGERRGVRGVPHLRAGGVGRARGGSRRSPPSSRRSSPRCGAAREAAPRRRSSRRCAPSWPPASRAPSASSASR